jgi:shikimate kinase
VATLSRRNMPPRVIAIVRDYFRDRFVEDGDLRVRVSCGVPQVSGLDNK